MPPVTRLCDNCGQPFIVQEHRFKHGRGKSCSLKCSYESRARNAQNRIERTCGRCGNTFFITPSMLGKGKGRYCSPSCHNPAAFAKCLHCGKDFRYSPSAAAQFCSKECTYASVQRTETCRQNFAKQWADETTRTKLIDGIRRRSQSPEWRNLPWYKRGPENPRYAGGKAARSIAGSRAEYKDWRHEVFARDNFTCQCCNIRGGKLVAHHVKAWAKFPELRYSVSNGLTLCHRCHVNLHRCS